MINRGGGGDENEDVWAQNVHNFELLYCLPVPMYYENVCVCVGGGGGNK